MWALSASSLAWLAALSLSGVAGFLLLCVDPESPGALGRAAAWLGSTAPAALLRALDRVRLGWTVRLPAAAAHWFVAAPHPLIQAAYVALLCGCYALVVVHGYPRIPNAYLAGWHKAGGAAALAACLVSFAGASLVDPGTVTRRNEAALRAAYPYDNFLYHDRPCATCGTSKVARSKHCRVCGRCVARFDHHCIWVNNCIGERNYRWFLAFLACNVAIMLYGVVAVASVLASVAAELRLFDAVFTSRATGERVPSTPLVVFQFLLGTHTELVMVGFICAVMGTVVAGFAAYHVALVAYNMTTNESAKWREAAWYHAEALRARAEDVAASAARLLKTGEADTLAEATAAADAAAPAVPAVPRNAYAQPRWVDNIRDALLPASVHPRSAAWLAAFRPALPPRPAEDDDAQAQAQAPPPPPPAAAVQPGGQAGGGARRR